MKFRRIIYGSWISQERITKLAPSLIYIALLILVYIYNVFSTQHMHRRVLRLESEISKLKVTQSTTQSKRVSITRQSYIIEQIERRNIPIFEPEKPPITIK